MTIIKKHNNIEENKKGCIKMLKFIGILLVLLGVTIIYEARVITKKYFGFGDQNEGSLGLKMTGFVLSIAGALIIFFN